MNTSYKIERHRCLIVVTQHTLKLYKILSNAYPAVGCQTTQIRFFTTHNYYLKAYLNSLIFRYETQLVYSLENLVELMPHIIQHL